MAKYLAKVSMTAEGMRALRQEKASGRRAMVSHMFEAAGGKLEAFYYAFGQDDLFIIADVPDNVSVASLSILVNSAGLVHASITPLLTVEEMDRAIDKAAGLTPPAR